MRVILSAIALFAATTSQAMVAPDVEYNGNLTFETQEALMQSLAAWAGDRERREFNMDGANIVMIIRHDLNLMWNLLPDTKTYMEASLDSSKKNGGGDLADYQIE